MSYQSVFNTNLFAGKVIIVTGGGSGIGRCTAHELASIGAKILLVGRTQSKLDTVKKEIEASGGTAETYAFDIRDEVAVRDNIAEMLKNNAGIHGLVNNAGGQFPAPAEKISANGFEAVVKSNLVGGFLVARELFNQHMEEHGGSIVNITADMWKGMPNMIHSGAARAGMDNVTKTLAVEWARSGVRVNSLSPGYIASNGLDTYTDPAFVELIPRLKDAVPLKRMGTESECSSAICYLLSDAAAYVTGEVIRVDGGCSLTSPIFTMQAAKNNAPYNGFHLSVEPEALNKKTSG